MDCCYSMRFIIDKKNVTRGFLMGLKWLEVMYSITCTHAFFFQTIKEHIINDYIKNALIKPTHLLFHSCILLTVKPVDCIEEF